MARLGNFSVVTSRRQADGDLTVNLGYKGKTVPHTRRDARWLETETFSSNGCDVMRVYFFTGGASCCYENYIMHVCGEEEFAFSLFNGPYEMEQTHKDLAAEGVFFTVWDRPFFEYTPHSAQEGPSLSFSLATAPAGKRLLLFDGKSWKMDEPGQFPAFYIPLLAETAKMKAGDPTDEVGIAILMAYYALLAGQDKTEAFAIFKERLPQVYAPIAKAVFAEVAGSVSGTSPSFVERINPNDLPEFTVVEHIVQRGETLYSIGRKYGVRSGAIFEANEHLKKAEAIKPGQTLRIPVPVTGKAATTKSSSSFR